MQTQGMVTKLSEGNRGALRPILAQQTARYDVTKKWVCLIIPSFLNH